MILATKLSIVNKVCKERTLKEIEKIYEDNELTYTYNKFSNKKVISRLMPYFKNDKKNDDDKINFILLKKIGKTTLPNKFKISLKKLKKNIKLMAQY